MARIFITLPSIAISWISTTPATGDDAETSLPPCAEVICMKAPVACCYGTVPRTHGSRRSSGRRELHREGQAAESEQARSRFIEFPRRTIGTRLDATPSRRARASLAVKSVARRGSGRALGRAWPRYRGPSGGGGESPPDRR